MRHFSKHSQEIITSTKYRTLLADFKENGAEWTTQQFRYFFNTGTLEKEIGSLTRFNFNFDYKNPTRREYGHQTVIAVLLEICSIIQEFGIVIPPLDISQMTNTYMPLAAWLAAAGEWVEDVIRPLFEKLKRYEPLSQLGGEYEKLKYRQQTLERECQICNDEVRRAEITAELTPLTEQISIFHRKITNILIFYTSDIRSFFRLSKKPHDLAQIKEEIIHFFPRIENLNTRDHKFSEKLPPSEQSEISYQTETMHLVKIKSKCGFEILACGLIFLAQQELDQPLNQRSIFAKIARLLPDIKKPDLEKMIREFRFRRTGPLYTLDCPVETRQSRLYFLVSILAKNLREILAKHQLSKLAADLKDDKSAMNGHLWSDIMEMFWHHYDKSPLLHSNTYVIHDNTIYKNILHAADHINRLENKSSITFVEKQGRPFQLKPAGFWLFISHILISAYSNMYGNDNYNINARLFTDGIMLFSLLTIADLEMLFMRKYSPTTDFGKLQISGRYESDIFYIGPYANNAAKYIKELPLPERELLVNHSYERKIQTKEMSELLRAHLSSDPRFGIIPNEERRANVEPNQGPSASSFQSFSSLFFSDSGEEKLKIREMELKPLNSRSRGYGTIDPALLSSLTSSINVDDEAVLRYKATEEDIITLAEGIFNIRVIFHNNPQSVQSVRIKDTKPVLHLYASNCNEMYLYIDPFPRASVVITPVILRYAISISTAHLTKDEIYQLFSADIPANTQPNNAMLSSNIDDYTRLMIDICNKCQEQNTTVAEVLDFIKTKLSTMLTSRRDSLDKIDYIFYRFYGKSFAEVVAVPLEYSGVSPSFTSGRRE